MCGIAGFVSPPDRKVLKKMVAALHHRGPDEDGYWENPEVSLGIRRLSIIDVETGQQPVFNEDRTIAAVFNGEIYNHIELRTELEAAGHSFRSDHSDSEVIVHLYEQFGAEFLSRLNGMFAIALWDAGKGELLLARDRVGIKPLYFSILGNGIAFGSEPKALLAHPSVSRDPDLAALHHYFSFKNVPSPMSAFKDIEQLCAGEMAVFRGGALQRRRWWNIRFDEDASIDEDAAAARIRELLKDSVGLQMRSDVPFGAYLSGGLDSSAVVAMMSEISSQPVKTFTLVYEDSIEHKDADRNFANSVAKEFGTDHHEHTVTHQDIPRFIDDITEAFDEPFSGVVSTFFLTQLIGQHVKVALSGDGADELFGSYLSHRLAIPLDIYHRYGDDIPAEKMAALGPYKDDLGALADIHRRGDLAAQRMGLYINDEDGKNALYSDKMRAAVDGASSEVLCRELLDRGDIDDPLNRMLFLDFETLLPDQVLAFVDRLAMAHSVEVRPPFLDHRLVEFVATLPGRFKIKNGRVKHILKEAVGGLLPDGIVDRPKEGFIMPINAWLLEPLRDFVTDILSPERLKIHGLFREEVVGTMINDHYAGRADHGNRLWNLVMFQTWWDRYVERG